MEINDRNSKGISFPAQFGILLGLVGAGLIISGIVSIAIWVAMTGKSFFAMETDMLKPQYYNVVMIIQGVSTFFMFFLPVYFTALISYRKPARFIGFTTNINYKQVLIIVAILFLTFPLSGALAELNKVIPLPIKWAAKFKAMEDSRTAQESALININSFSKYILSMVMIGLLPGIFEEVCFRAGLQNILTRWFKGPWIAIIITSIIFSLVHISYYGFLVRFALGVILGLIFYYSKNIWLSALFHFLYNGLQVTLLYVFTLAGNKDQKDIEENFPIWAGVFALVLIYYLFMQFKKISLIQKAKVKDDDFPDDEFDFTKWPAEQS